MKTVGILTRIEMLSNKEILYITNDLYKSLQEKVNIILIPTNNNDLQESILERINMCDGIVLPGGDDLIPLEKKLIQKLYKDDIPTLGICLGMQEMAEAINGKVMPLNNLNHKVLEKKYVHEVTINPQSLLYKILQEEKILVNSRHKDHVVNTTLFVGAKSLDGTIEEVEDASKKFFMGFQWHPENLFDENSLKIFDYFIQML